MRRRRLVPGENLNNAISASTWNDLLSLLDHRDRHGLWGAPQQVQRGDFERPAKATEVWVKNDSGSHLSQFAVVAVSAPAVDSSVYTGEFKREVVFSVTAPTTGCEGKFAILKDSIPSGQYGKAIISGAVQCQVDIDSADHDFAECESGNTSTLTSGVSGSAQILWRQQDSGAATWCIVRLGNYVSSSMLLIRNDSGGARRKGEALEVTGVVSTPIADTNEVLKGELRAIEAARGILLADASTSAVAPFALAGLVYAEIDILDADHTHCYCKSSDANPQTNFGGPWRIVAKPTGTGNAQAALLLLGDGCYERKVKTAATLTAGSSASCDFYVDGSVKGQETVYFNWMENGIASIASGKEGIARWFDDEEKWVMVASEC